MARQNRGLKLLDSIENKDIKGVKQILKYDVDLTVDKKGDAPIHLAARKGYLDMVKLLVENGCDVNLKNQNGFVALHYAARDGRMDMVHFLTKHGAKPNIQNADGDAPIHQLVKYQPMDVIEEMVNLGMDINLTNQMGRTPLHVAAAFDRLEAMETLLLCGAKSSIKDMYGRTAGDSCKNPQFADIMKLHSLTLMAIKKGTIKAQGIAVTKQKAKSRIQLGRVGVAIETIDLTSDVSASFYVRREKSENSSIIFRTDIGDEMLSDVFSIKITNVPVICEATLTVPMYDMPTDTEELFVRFDNGAKHMVTNTHNTEEEYFCTFSTKLIPDDFCVCALFTRARTDVKKVGQEGGVVTTNADKEMKLEIPADTFNEETNISIQIFPTESSAEEISDTIFTDIYSLDADHVIGNSKMTLTVPLHQDIDNEEDVALVTAKEISDDNDERCLTVVDVVPRIEGHNLVYEIPHFSIHVAVSRKQYYTDEKGIYDSLVRATERQRSAVFFVVAQYEKETGPIIVVECSRVERCSQRIEKWTEYGYMEQSPEQSGIFMLRPCQEFYVSFHGVITAEDTEKRKLSFLPRRASFQPFRLSLDSKVGTCIEGTVVIQKAATNQGKVAKRETLTVLPFSIKIEDQTKQEWLTHPDWRY